MRRHQLLELSAHALPPVRTRVLLLMVAEPFDAHIIPAEQTLSFAQRLLDEALLLQNTLLPPHADIDMLLSACFACLAGCPALAHAAPDRLNILQTIVRPLADVLAHRNTTTAISADGLRVCWDILLRYTEGLLSLEHKDVWFILQPLAVSVRPAQTGARPWVSRKQAWQVLQVLDGRLLPDSNHENADILKKATELALALLGPDPAFGRSRELAQWAQDHLKAQGGNANWPTDLRVLRALFRGQAPSRRFVTREIMKFALAGASPPEPDVGAAAALLLAEAAALDAWAIGAAPDLLLTLAEACEQLLKAEPLEAMKDKQNPKPRQAVEINELMCAVSALLASPLESGPARTAWERVGELLLRRWQLGEYQIAGVVLLDVVWPRLPDAGPLDAKMARRLALVHAWNPPLQSRVIQILCEILRVQPGDREAARALAECEEYVRDVALEEQAQAARDKLRTQEGLSFSLRPASYDYQDAIEWASLQMHGYVPSRHRHVLQELAQLTRRNEEYVRIQWFLSRTHPGLQARDQPEAARKEWPAFWFDYDRWVKVTVTGTDAQVLIGRMLLEHVIEELRIPANTLKRTAGRFEFNAEEVDVRALRQRLCDPRARIGDAKALASKVEGERNRERNKWHPEISYLAVIECLVGCLLRCGRPMEAADACDELLAVNGLQLAELAKQCVEEAAPEATSALLARLIIVGRLRSDIGHLEDMDVVFEAIAKELEWRDPDLGVKARLEWVVRQRRDDRPKVMQACSPALPLSLDLSTWHASMSAHYVPSLPAQAELQWRRKPIDDGHTWLPVLCMEPEHKLAALPDLACHPPKGLTLAEFRRVQPEAAAQFLRVAGSDSCDLPEDWEACIKGLASLEGQAQALMPLLVAATFPDLVQLNEQEAPAAMGAMAYAIGRLLKYRYPQAARRLLDSVPASGRSLEWHALDACVSGLAHQAAESTELPLPASRPAASLQMWLAPPGVVHVDSIDPAQCHRAMQLLKDYLLRLGVPEDKVALSGTTLEVVETSPPVQEKALSQDLSQALSQALRTLQAVLDLRAMLLMIDEAGQTDDLGALDLFSLLLHVPDGPLALAAIEDGSLGVTAGATEDIAGSHVRWTIPAGARAFQSLAEIALWLLGKSAPAGFGLLHRLIRSDMPQPLREALVAQVLLLWQDVNNRRFRAVSHAGWANFFALALRQPGFEAQNATAMKDVRRAILMLWYEGRYIIAAPVVLALLSSCLAESDADADEPRLLQRLYEQPDSAPVRGWIRQRAMRLGVFGDFPLQQENAWSAEHRQILESMLAQRGYPLEALEIWVASDVYDGQLMMALAAHLLDAEQAARLLLRNVEMLRGAAMPLAAVALKLPSASAELLDNLIAEWNKRREGWWSDDARALAITTVALSNALVAAGKGSQSTSLLYAFEGWLKKERPALRLNWRSGELREGA